MFHEPGLGKTRTALEIYKILRKDNPSLRLLVICPISLIEGAWRPDVEQFTDFKSFHNAHKLGLPQGILPDVFALNYEYFVREDKVRRLLPILTANDIVCVLDESSKIKNHSSITTKSLLALAPLFKHRVVMTGTPAPNDETEYWAQLRFVSPDVFPSSFHKFRNVYFRLMRNGKPIETNGMIMSRQAMQELFKRGAEYRTTEESKRALFERMIPWIHTAKTEDVHDLPEQIDEKRMVEMGPKQKRAYMEMKRSLITEINDKKIVASVALAKVMKLREITSGFAMNDVGEAVDLGECPKLKVLEEILEDIGAKPAIIWCQFDWENEKIAAALEAKYPGLVRTLYGQTKDKEKSIKDFSDGTSRYLVAHPKSAAHGLRFHHCQQEIFFSLDYSWEAYEQGRKRTHRYGQKEVCVYHHLLCEATIDTEILDVLKRKGDAQDIVFRICGGGA